MTDDLLAARQVYLGEDTRSEVQVVITNDSNWDFIVSNSPVRADDQKIHLRNMIRISAESLLMMAKWSQLESGSDEAKLKFIKLLQGIIAHEIAHGIDYVEVFREDGDIKRATSDRRKQLIETKADVFAHILLSDIGSGQSTFYDALDTLDQLSTLSSSTSSLDAYKSAASTHPPTAVRKVVNRLLATYKRFNEGVKQSNRIELLSQSSFTDDLETLRSVVVVKPKETLIDYLQDLKRRISESPSSYPGTKVTLKQPGGEPTHFVRLLTETEGGLPLSQSDFKLALEIYQELEKTTEFILLTASERGFNKESIYAEATQRLHFFRDERFVNILLKRYRPVPAADETTKIDRDKLVAQLELCDTLSRRAHRGAFWHAYMPILQQTISRVSFSENTPEEVMSSISRTALRADGSAVYLLRVLPLVQDLIQPNGLALNKYEPLLWTNDDFKTTYRQLKLRGRNNRLNQELQTQLIAIESWYRDIWRLRGVIEIENLLAQGQSSWPDSKTAIDWSFVGEVNGIDPRVVRGLVVQAANDFLKEGGGHRVGSDNFEVILEKIKVSQFHPPRTETAKSSVDPSTLKLLLGHDGEPGSDVRDRLRVALGSMTPKARKYFYTDELKNSAKTVSGLPEQLSSWLDRVVSKADSRQRESVIQYLFVALNRVNASSATPAEKIATKRQLSKVYLQATTDYNGKRNLRDAVQAPGYSKVIARLLDEGIISRSYEVADLLGDPGALAVSVEQNVELFRLDLQKDVAEGRFKDHAHFYSITEKILALLAETDRFSENHPDSPHALTGRQKANQVRRAILETADVIGLSKPELWRLFLLTTQTASNRLADSVFETELLPWVLEQPNKTQLLKNVLVERRLLRETLIVQTTRAAFSEDMREIRKSGVEADTHRLIDELLSFLPHSGATDELLNEIGWYPVSEVDLHRLEMATSAKSANHLSADLMRMISFLSDKLDLLPNAERFDLIRYLSATRDGRQQVKFPETAWRLLLRTERVLLAAGKEAAKANVATAGVDLSGNMQLADDYFKEGFTDHAERASESEIIPLIDLILHSGRNGSLFASPLWRQRIVTELIGYAPGTLASDAVASYVEVADKTEKSVTFAYLLAKKRTGSAGALVHIFPTFGAIGIKLGQTLADWGLLPASDAEELQKLKDDGPKMPRWMVESIMKRLLPRPLFVTLRKKMRLLSAASLKTVAAVTDASGNEIAMGVQSDFVIDQNQTNLDFGRKFVNSLMSKTEHDQSSFFLDLLGGMQEQMGGEEDMLIELQKLRELKAAVDRLAPSFRKELGGWMIDVVQPVSYLPQNRQLIFMTMAKGETFRKVQKSNPRAISDIGPGLLMMSSALQFREGIFDADPHGGNRILDVANHKAYLIDAGQIETISKTGFLKSDDRVLMSEFLRGIDQKDEVVIERTLLKMAKTSSKKDLLAPEIKSYFSKHPGANLSETILAISSMASNRGIHLRTTFLMGMFKGLLLLKNNGYATEKQFNEIVRQEIKRLYSKKPAAALRAALDTGVQFARTKATKFKVRCEAVLVNESAQPGNP